MRPVTKLLCLALSYFSAAACAGEASIVYLSKPETGGIFAAYLTTGLRGEELERNLDAELRGHCKDAPMLSRYRITVFSDEGAARAALDQLLSGKIPNSNSPEYSAVQRATLAFYEPDNGVLKVRRKSDGWHAVNLGKDWCKQ